jgi:hypothetical protein
MSLALPAADSPLRAHIDVAQLAAIGADRKLQARIPGLPQAVRSARALFAAEPAACAMHMLVLRCSGALQLWRMDRGVGADVDAHGQPVGAEAVWTFGKL